MRGRIISRGAVGSYPDAVEQLDQLDPHQPVVNALAVPRAGQNPGLAKRRKMLGGNRLRNFGGHRDIPHAGLAAAQEIDHTQANGVCCNPDQRSRELQLLQVEKFGP
jgi:hypothetical protein